MTVNLRRSFSFCGAAGAALILSSCVPAAVAGAAVGAGIVASVLISNCHEPVSVQVWDHTSSHPVCDAEVVAEQEGSVTTFSPCYQTYLGTGMWKVTATKRGIGTATGMVEISKDRQCNEPAFHSLDLTLGTDATQSPAAMAAAEPPLEPPEIRSVRHGLCVAP